MPGMNELIRNNYIPIFLAMALLLAGYDITANKAGVPLALLSSLLLFNVGVQCMVSSVMHWYRPLADNIAKGIGWEPGSPFQKEVASANAGFGVLGVLSFFIRGDFLAATAVGASIMIFLMGMVHVLDIRKNKNLAPLNAGAVVYFDLLLPPLMLLLLVLWKMGY